MVTDRDLGDEDGCWMLTADGIAEIKVTPDRAETEHWLLVAQRHGPIVQAAKEWSAARADCMTKAVTPGSFARLALAEAALQSVVANLRGDDPDRRSDVQAQG